MEINLTPEQEMHLAEIARQAGKPSDQFITEAVLSLLDDDDSFRVAVREGLAQANSGVFLEEEEMDARFEKMMRG
jgi:predicted transcriptional regulator